MTSPIRAFVTLLIVASAASAQQPKPPTRSEQAKLVLQIQRTEQLLKDRKWSAAEKEYDALIPLIEKHLGPDDLDSLMQRANRAYELYRQQGRYTKALEELRGVLVKLRHLDAANPRAEKVENKDLPDVLQRIAAVEHDLGDDAASLEACNDAIRLLQERKLTRTDDAAACFMLRGRIRTEAGNTPDAREDFAKALVAAEALKDASLQVNSRCWLAGLHLREAEEFLRDGDALTAEKRFVEAEPFLAKAEQLLAGIEKPTNRVTLLYLRERQSRIGAAVKAKVNPYQPTITLSAIDELEHRRAHSLREVAVRHDTEKKYREADETFSQAIKTLRGAKRPNRELEIELLHSHAFVRGARLGRWEEAVGLAAEALELSYQKVTNNLRIQTNWEQQLHISEYESGLWNFVTLAFHAGRPPAEVYQQVLRWKSVQFGAGSWRGSKEDHDAYRKLAEAVSEARRVADCFREDRSATPEMKRETDGELARCERALNAFRFRDGTDWKGPTPAEFAGKLPKGVAFVDFAAYQHKEDIGTKHLRYVAFVLRAGKEVEMVPLPARVADLARDLTQWQELRFQSASKSDRDLQKQFDDASKTVVGHVWTPLAEKCQGARGLWISPVSSLWELSFAALPIKNGRYLVEDVPVAYACSGRQAWLSLTDPRKPGRNIESCVAVTELLYAKEEQQIKAGAKVAAGLMGRLPGYTARKGSEVTKTKLLQDVRSAGNVCFIGHGICRREIDKRTLAQLGANPLPRDGQPANVVLDLRLPLSGADALNPPDFRNPRWAEQWVSAEEIGDVTPPTAYRFELWACSGGLGPTHATEGVIGFPRRLLMSGYRVVVTSLWDADQQPTLETIVPRFHCEVLDRKRNDAVALRRAQICAIEKGGPDAHPCNWAAWVVVGDPGWDTGEPEPAELVPPETRDAETSAPARSNWRWLVAVGAIAVIGVLCMAIALLRRKVPESSRQ